MRRAALASAILAVAVPCAAGAAGDPCYGHTFDDRVDSESFWVEWEPGAITLEQAVEIAGDAERAREVYLDLGWPLTGAPMAYAVLDDPGEGIGGFAQTMTCGDEAVPRFELYMGAFDSAAALDVTAHELGHGAEYGFMGAYLDSVASWLWFMEGTATWLALQVHGDVGRYADDAQGYLDNPHLALHHDVSGYLDADTSRHMYGTAFLVRHVEERYGANRVRGLWAAGAAWSGEPIAFPDAVEGANLSFDDMWPRFLAAAAVVDTPDAASFGRLPPRAGEVAVLPAAGGPPEGLEPQGLGFSVTHFAAGAGERGSALQVFFDGDPSVDWQAVLLRSDGDGVGSPVVDYVPVPVLAGHGGGWLSGFDGSVDAFLVVSPVSTEAVGHDYAWSADRVRDPGPMQGTVSLRDWEEARGCATAPAPWAWIAWGGIFAVGFRRAGVLRRGPPAAKQAYGSQLTTPSRSAS